MAMMTIAQMRKREVLRLARYREKNPTNETMREARRLMNSFYRLAGLDDRLLYLSNDSRTCNSRYTKEQEDRAYRWWRRLSKEFTNFCPDLKIQYFGHLPSIATQDNHIAVSAHYYGDRY